jgi:glycosyltransferase involved in cell wall biosynthesis
MKDRYILVFGLFPNESRDYIAKNSIGSIQYAANNLQWAFLKGFEENANKEVTLLNSMYLGSFPFRFRKLIVPTFNFGNGNYINVGYINITFFKEFFRTFTLWKHLRRIIDKDGSSIIILYALTYTNISLATRIANRYKRVKVIIIVPDLPEYMNLNGKKSIIYIILKHFSNHYIKARLRNVSGFIYLTEQMAKRVTVTKPYCVIEGILNDSPLKQTDIDFCEIKNDFFFYSGSLSEQYGVKAMVDNFLVLKNTLLKLVICGTGELEDYISRLSKINKNIIFLGQIDNDRVKAYQRSALALINPRQNNSDYTKYSFPSKLIEYMHSGRPVIAYKLDGVPNEYNDFIFLVDDYDMSLANAMTHVISLDRHKLDEMGLKAKTFIETFKSPTHQIAKAIKFIKEI